MKGELDAKHHDGQKYRRQGNGGRAQLPGRLGTSGPMFIMRAAGKFDGLRQVGRRHDV